MTPPQAGERPRPKSITLANQLTLARFAMALAMFAALTQPPGRAHVVAFVLFVAAMITDWVDGYVARMTGTVSAFGKVADPIADKILVIGALFGLMRLRVHIPPWAVFLIIARELLMGGVRVLTVSQQGGILAAQRWGKISMVVQSTAVAIIIGLVVLGESRPMPAWAQTAPYPLTVLCAFFAWLSAIIYFRESRKLIEKSWA